MTRKFLAAAALAAFMVGGVFAQATPSDSTQQTGKHVKHAKKHKKDKKSAEATK